MTDRFGTFPAPRLALLAAALFVAASATAQSQSSTEYRFSFPDAVHHVMQVEATFHNVPIKPLTLTVSRASPGRYAAFEFASNIFEEHFTDGSGHPLAATKTDPRNWSVPNPDGTVHVSYKLFGDRVDGTFFAVDTTHAHLNFPAVLMYAPALDDDPTRLTFALPQGSDWKIATQLYPSADAHTFTAPNLQYLMDSPVELSNFRMRTFTVPPLVPSGKTETIRVVAHSQASDSEFDAYFASVQKLVREEQAIFGELPAYEPGYYTFLADALPWDSGDGMEHRNSTVMTGHQLSLSTVAHEYFHNWNVERIRPEGLEPFSFRDTNMSGEMFLAEGFTQYYGNLALLRSGITSANDLGAFADDLTYVLGTPGSSYRSAMDMSRLAPLVDGSSDDFPKYWTNDFVSYYSYGDVTALGLDLTLRARSNSAITLDDFMRAMWHAYGKPGGPAPGLVGHPYTIADVETQLATVSHDPAFAADFVRRYMAGTEKVDYAPLLLRAGFVLRKQDGPPTLGRMRLKAADHALLVADSTLIGTPAYNAGIDRDDELLALANTPLATPEDLQKALGAHKAGDSVAIHLRRRGQDVHTTAILADPTDLEFVPVERTGTPLTPQQQQFREAWLGSKAK
ncbi:M61 family metallopeptidase [Acidipila sp. EB88]|uniref:M61 family metallopeptidase n=1 Tax=Acidipila sp. EB88 TaxID=2305226 RepID=UPI001315541D|nr:PDZ domain-containing protein [Acidipila sp. EB88]